MKSASLYLALFAACAVYHAASLPAIAPAFVESVTAPDAGLGVYSCYQMVLSQTCLMTNTMGQCYTIDASGNAISLSCGDNSPIQYSTVAVVHPPSQFPGSFTSNAFNWTAIQSYSFIFNTTTPWSNTAYVVVYGPIVQLCLDGTCCLGTSCMVKLPDGSSRLLSYDSTTGAQRITVTIQAADPATLIGQSISAPLVTLNTTHSWANWNLSQGVANQSITVTRLSQCRAQED